MCGIIILTNIFVEYTHIHGTTVLCLIRLWFSRHRRFLSLNTHPISLSAINLNRIYVPVYRALIKCALATLKCEWVCVRVFILHLLYKVYLHTLSSQRVTATGMSLIYRFRQHLYWEVFLVLKYSDMKVALTFINVLQVLRICRWEFLPGKFLHTKLKHRCFYGPFFRSTHPS